VSTTEDALEERMGVLLRAGDYATAASLAVRSYGPQILGYLQAVLRSRDDGAAAFSDFCHDLWSSIGAYTRRSSFKAWAYAIAWRTIENPRRKRPRLLRPEVEQLAREVRSLAAPYLQTVNDRLAELRRALDPAEQTLLILRIDRAMSWAEVAEVLAEVGVGEANLRKRFEHIKRRLRDLAAARGLVPHG
jgi:RNA polymerase sigma-70 factor (ECF subfamily)